MSYNLLKLEKYLYKTLGNPSLMADEDTLMAEMQVTSMKPVFNLELHGTLLHIYLDEWQGKWSTNRNALHRRLSVSADRCQDGIDVDYNAVILTMLTNCVAIRVATLQEASGINRSLELRSYKGKFNISCETCRPASSINVMEWIMSEISIRNLAHWKFVQVGHHSYLCYINQSSC